MADVVLNMANLTSEDRLAIAAYLKALPGAGVRRQAERKARHRARAHPRKAPQSPGHTDPENRRAWPDWTRCPRPRGTRHSRGGVIRRHIGPQKQIGEVPRPQRIARPRRCLVVLGRTNRVGIAASARLPHDTQIVQSAREPGCGGAHHEPSRHDQVHRRAGPVPIGQRQAVGRRRDAPRIARFEQSAPRARDRCHSAAARDGWRPIRRQPKPHVRTRRRPPPVPADQDRSPPRHDPGLPRAATARGPPPGPRARRRPGSASSPEDASRPHSPVPRRPPPERARVTAPERHRAPSPASPPASPPRRVHASSARTPQAATYSAGQSGSPRAPLAIRPIRLTSATALPAATARSYASSAALGSGVRPSWPS
jgi:hypothetical protein